MKKKAVTKRLDTLVTAVDHAGAQNRNLATEVPCFSPAVGNDIPQDQNLGEVKDYCFFGLVHVTSHPNLDVTDQSPNL